MTFEEWAEINIQAPLRGHAQAGSEYVEGHKQALLTIAKSAWKQAIKNRAVSVDVSTCDEDGDHRIYAVLTGEEEGDTLLAVYESKNF